MSIRKRDILSTELVAGEVRAKIGSVTADDGGEADDFVLYGISGFISRPADPEPDKSGACQAVIAQFGNDARVIGTKDNRMNARVGELAPGDCAIVTPGPARLMVKNEKKSITALTENDDGQTLVFQLSGKQNNLTIMLPGSDGTTMVQMKSGEIKMAVEGGGGILIDKKGFHAYGEVAELLTGSVDLSYTAPGAPNPPTNGVAITTAGPVNVISTKVRAAN